MAESLRCFSQEFPITTKVAKFVRGFSEPDNVRVICLDDIMQDQTTFNTTMRGVFEWLKITCAELLLDKIAVQGPAYNFGNNQDHVTDHGAHRKILLDTLLYLDKTVLQARILEAENETGCARLF